MRRPRTLATKLILVTGGAIAMVLPVSNLVPIPQTQSRVSQLVHEDALSRAGALAAGVAGDIGALASAARSIAGVIERGHAGAHLDRATAVDLLRAGVETNVFASGHEANWNAPAGLRESPPRTAGRRSEPLPPQRDPIKGPAVRTAGLPHIEEAGRIVAIARHAVSHRRTT